MQDIVGSITRPVRELKGIQHVELKSGETKTIQFTIHPDDLKFVNNALQTVVEVGQFNIWIGANSSEGLQVSFELK